MEGRRGRSAPAAVAKRVRTRVEDAFFVPGARGRVEERRNRSGRKTCESGYRSGSRVIALRMMRRRSTRRVRETYQLFVTSVAPFGMWYPATSSFSSLVFRATASTLRQRPLSQCYQPRINGGGRTEWRDGRPAIELEDERTEVGQGRPVREHNLLEGEWAVVYEALHNASNSLTP